MSNPRNLSSFTLIVNICLPVTDRGGISTAVAG